MLGSCKEWSVDGRDGEGRRGGLRKVDVLEGGEGDSNGILMS